MRPEVKALLGKVPGAAFWEAIERPEWNEARGKGIAWRWFLGGDRETGIEWGQRQKHCLERWELMATFLYVSLLLFQPYLLGSDVGPLWSQGLEGSSVSIGCEVRKLWKGWLKYTSLLWSQGLEGSSASIGCEIRKLWKGWRKYVSLSYSSTPICWAPMWDLVVARIRRNFSQ